MADLKALGLAIALVSASVAHAGEGGSTASAPAPTFKDPATGMEFVLVKGGCFQMGDVYGDFREGDEEAPALPVHEVCVDAFYVGKYEVTVAQWRSLMSSDPSSRPVCRVDTCPVDNVTYREVQEFIGKLNAKDGGRKFRLPTEAEWEYAARSGGRVERYSGGNDVESVSWFTCPNPEEPCYHPVGSKLPNGLGTYDMSGNVYEITSDWLNPAYYATSPRDNPKGPESGTYHVKRGGCGNGGPRNSRVTRRTYFSDPNPMTGFRLVRIP